jgi:methylmalonyl-CoA epimerase
VELPLDHVAIAVPSLDVSLPLFELLTGARGSSRERVESQGVDVVFLGQGSARIELIQPLGPESTVTRFLAKRGPGLHHIAYRVPDLPAALARFTEAGIEAIDKVPRLGAHNRRIAFLHPKSTGGVLIELVEEKPVVP